MGIADQDYVITSNSHGGFLTGQCLWLIVDEAHLRDHLGFKRRGYQPRSY
ncbi:unnamed protein product [Acidithrix sp. C25]|nr:unnamed protein product [Acidithrix sp. C25]